jgi:hypothetical protein
VRDKAYLFAAWGNTGKTNLVLELSSRDDSYLLSDDWTLLRPDGKVSSYPRPLNMMNYNSDLFPEKMKEFSWDKRLITFVDKVWRKRIAPFCRTGFRLRAYRVFERALEIASVTHIPLVFDDASQKTHSIGFLGDIQKGDPERVTEGVTIPELATRSAVCFLYENARLFDRIQEFDFANYGQSDFKGAFRKKYYEDLQLLLEQNKAIPLFTICIPPRPSRDKIRQISDSIIS